MTKCFPSDRSYGMLIGLLLLLASGTLHAQCNPSDQIPAMDCEWAPFVCLQNACYTSNPYITQSCCFNWCGNSTVIDNPQYFQFVPTSTNVEMHIHVDGCYSGVGLQCAILDACPWDNSNVIDCNPGTPAGGTMVLSASGLVIGQLYWLLIDGTNGAVCNYTIDFVSGIESPGFGGMSLTNGIASPASVCAGFLGVELSASPEVIGAHGYYWVLGWSGDTITSTLPDIQIDIPQNVPSGHYNVCVRAFSGCDTSDMDFCFPIEINKILPVDKAPDTFCMDAFPFMWGSLIIPGPGEYHQHYSSPDGCKFDSNWVVSSFPQNPMGILDTTICESLFWYEGQQYLSSGTYPLNYPGQGANGCDSLAMLHLDFQRIEAFIQVDCLEDSIRLHPNIVQADSGQEMHYTWRLCKADSIWSEAPEFYPDTPGCYSLTLIHGACEDTFQIVLTDTSCHTDCQLTNQDAYCLGDSVFFESTISSSPATSIHWLIDLPVAPWTYYATQDTFAIPYSLPGQYGAYITWNDEFGTHVCEDTFIVIPTDTITICCDTVSCDSCVWVKMEASPGPSAIQWTDGSATFALDDFTSTSISLCPPRGINTHYHFFNPRHTALGCDAIISGEESLNILLPEVPLVSIVKSGDTLCALTEGLAQYLWNDCNGNNVGNTSCILPATSGCYCVVITDMNSCTNMTCTDFIIDAAHTISPEPIKIYPNPFTNDLILRAGDQILSNCQWEIRNILGVQEAQGKLNEDGTIQIGKKIPSGLYLLQVLRGNLPVFSTRLIRE